MDYKTIYDLLKTLNIPVAYDHFDSNKIVKPPLIVYRELSQETFKADGITYHRGHNYEIELATTKKEPTIQDSIETLLTNNNIPFDIEPEIWDEDEKIYHYFYQI